MNKDLAKKNNNLKVRITNIFIFSTLSSFLLKDNDIVDTLAYNKFLQSRSLHQAKPFLFP